MIDGRGGVFGGDRLGSLFPSRTPSYHIEGVHASLQRAAAHLPRVDAIGGSAAGVYVNNEVRIASLFRGVPADQFAQHIRGMFRTLRERWGGVPFEVANDGEVTALAGSMALHDNAGVGRLDGHQHGRRLRARLGRHHDLAQRAGVCPRRLQSRGRPATNGRATSMRRAVFFPAGASRVSPAGRDLVFPQRCRCPSSWWPCSRRWPRATRAPRAVYETVGACFGYAIGHYAAFYEFRHLLLLGRVTSGEGGALIVDRATAVLRTEFPALAGRLSLHLPDEKSKRHGQAIAAASLPALVPV